MPDQSSSTYRIERLRGGDNYSVWKVLMEDILADQDLIGYADGSIPEPSDTTAKGSWKKKDRSALATIRLRVEPGPLTHVRGAKTSQSAWTTLESMYEPKGAIGIVMAR